MAFGSYQPENLADLTSDPTARMQKVGAIRAKDTGIYGDVFKDQSGIIWSTPYGGKWGQASQLVPLTGPNAVKMPDGRAWSNYEINAYLDSTHLAETQQEGTDWLGEALGKYGMPLMAAAMGAAGAGLIPGAASIGGSTAGSAIGAGATDMSLGAAGAVNAADAAAGIGSTAAVGTGATAGLDSLSAWETGMSGGAPAGATGGAGALAGTPYASMPTLPTVTLPGSGVSDEMLLTGQNAANTGTLGTMAEGAISAGAVGSAAASGGSVWDDIAKALGITTTAAGTNGLKDIIGGLISGYGAKDTANTYADAIKYAADKSDPFGAQRPLYQTLFNSMNAVGGAPATKTPFDTPWMQNLTNTTVDNTAQRLSSKYGGDVSNLGAKNIITQNVNAANTPVAMDYLKTIGNAAGMNITPNSGEVLANGANNSAKLNTSIYGNYGVATDSALDMLFRNIGNKNNTTQPAANNGWSV